MGWAFICIGALFFIFSYRRFRRHAYENVAREKLKSLGSTPLAYEAVEPLKPEDIRLLKRQLYYMVVMMTPISCLPAIFLFFADDSSKGYIYFFMLMWLVVVLLISGQSYSNIMRIRKAGKKIVIRGIVTDRFKKYETRQTSGGESTTAIPILKIGDRELQAKQWMYRRYNVGDAVEFHYAEMSFFGLMKYNLYFYHTKIKGAGIMDSIATNTTAV